RPFPDKRDAGDQKDEQEDEKAEEHRAVVIENLYILRTAQILNLKVRDMAAFLESGQGGLHQPDEFAVQRMVAAFQKDEGAAVFELDIGVQAAGDDTMVCFDLIIIYRHFGIGVLHLIRHLLRHIHQPDLRNIILPVENKIKHCQHEDRCKYDQCQCPCITDQLLQNPF